jgi:hypothetical protein
MRWLVLGSLTAALGCTESVESTDIRTSGIYPEFTVTANGSGSSRVVARLKVGGSKSNTYLDLKGGDELRASVGDETKVLDETSDETYTASFNIDDEGTEFTIGFFRSEEDESAPASVVRLPAPFDMAVEPSEASRATDDIEVSWAPEGDGDIAMHLDGDCIITQSDDVPDDGAHTVSADSIDTFESDEMESCTVEVELERARRGSIDAEFSEGGRIEAIQIRSGSFTSIP